MEISPTQSPLISGATANKTASDGNLISSDFETFLKMLTAQARYQDPLQPLDSTEYASQLATFSGVEQQVKTNDLLEAMAGQIGASNMAQFAGWIGMEARTDQATYFDGTSKTVHPNPAAVADQVQLVVLNEAGSEVQRLDMPISAAPFEWTGRRDNGGDVDPGVYSFRVDSFAQGKLVLSEAAQTYSRITEARSQGAETVLILEGGATVQSADISALREAA